MSQQNVAVIQGAYEAFARGDVAAVLAAMDPAIVWNEAENFPYADRNPYIGLAAVGDGLFRRIAEDWDHFEVAVEEILDGGDRVVALARPLPERAQDDGRQVERAVRARLVAARREDHPVSAVRRHGPNPGRDRRHSDGPLNRGVMRRARSRAA